MSKTVIDKELLEKLIEMMQLSAVTTEEKSLLLQELANTLAFVENLNNIAPNDTSTDKNEQKNVWFDDAHPNSRSLEDWGSLHLDSDNFFAVDKVL